MKCDTHEKTMFQLVSTRFNSFQPQCGNTAQVVLLGRRGITILGEIG